MKDKLVVFKVQNKFTGRQKLLPFIVTVPETYDLDECEPMTRSKIPFWYDILYVELFHNLLF